MPEPTDVIIVNRPPRPLLSRVAEAAFWIGRYVERAEHVARALVVNIHSLLDVGDMEETVERRLWGAPVRTFGLGADDAGKAVLEGPREGMPARVAAYMTFDAGNPNSIYSCITRARENARSVRENTSAEMWENLNALYWMLRADDAPARLEESPADLLKQVMTGSLLFQGLTDQTLAHGQVWQFLQLGRYLERMHATTRVIEVKLAILREVEGHIESTERNTHLLSIVRTCCALESYRRRNVGEIDPDRIACFLLLERRFPRSVCFCAREAHQAIGGVRAETRPSKPDVAESVLGRLYADLLYTQPAEVRGDLLTPFLQRVQQAAYDATAAVMKGYFLQ